MRKRESFRDFFMFIPVLTVDNLLIKQEKKLWELDSIITLRLSLCLLLEKFCCNEKFGAIYELNFAWLCFYDDVNNDEMFKKKTRIMKFWKKTMKVIEVN